MREILAALLAVTAIGLLATPAQAEDDFYFESSAGTSFLGVAMDSPEPGCWFGATGNLVWEAVAEDGSIRSEDSPLTGCREWWGAQMTYRVEDRGFGAIQFFANDPEDGSSTVTCEALGAEWAAASGYAPIERFLTAEAEGRTCLVEALPSNLLRPGPGLLAARQGWHSRIVDSLARVRGRAAKVRVQVFGAGRRRVEDEVLLLTGSGRVIGRASRTSRVGSGPLAIRVRLARFARKKLAKKGELVVKALLSHADGTPGTGDVTESLVLRQRSR